MCFYVFNAINIPRVNPLIPCTKFPRWMIKLPDLGFKVLRKHNKTKQNKKAKQITVNFRKECAPRKTKTIHQRKRIQSHSDSRHPPPSPLFPYIFYHFLCFTHTHRRNNRQTNILRTIYTKSFSYNKTKV